jgi:opacity protein-like surface antigen
MRILPLASLVLVSSLAPSISAQVERESPWYLTFDIGADSVVDIDSNPTGTVSYDTGISSSLAVGRHLFGGKLAFNGELETFYSFTRLDDGDLVKLSPNSPRDHASLALLVNGMLEWNLGKSFAWYGGVGVGYASVRLDSFDFGDLDQVDKSALAYQFKIGALYRLGQNLDFLLGYRYFQTEDIQIDNVVTLSSFDVTNQENIFEAGLRWGL